MYQFKNFLLCLSVLGLAACGGGGGSDEEDRGVSFPDPAPPQATGSIVVSEKSSDSCLNGGVDIETGFDLNGNGELDASEVRNTYTVCNGVDGGYIGIPSTGVMLTEATPFPTSAECAEGGIVVNRGIDGDRNGQLDEYEIDSANSFELCLNNNAPYFMTYDNRRRISNVDTLSVTHVLGVDPDSLLGTQSYLLEDAEGHEVTVTLENAPSWLTFEIEEVSACARFYNGYPNCEFDPVERHLSFEVSGEAAEGQYDVQVNLDDGQALSSYNLNYVVTIGNRLSWSSPQPYVEGVDDFAFTILQAERPVSENVDLNLDISPYQRLFICESVDIDTCLPIESTIDFYETVTLPSGASELIFAVRLDDDERYSPLNPGSIDVILGQTDLYITEDDAGLQFVVEDDEQQPVVGLLASEVSIRPTSGTSLTIYATSSVGRFPPVPFELESNTLVQGIHYQVNDSQFRSYNQSVTLTLLRDVSEADEITIRLLERPEYYSEYYALDEALAVGQINFDSNATVTGEPIAGPPASAPFLSLGINAVPSGPNATTFKKHSDGSLYLGGTVEGAITGEAYVGGTSDVWYGIWNEAFDNQFVKQFGTDQFDTLLALHVADNGHVYAVVQSSGAGEERWTLYRFDESGEEQLSTGVSLGADISLSSGQRVEMAVDNAGSVYLLSSAAVADYNDDFTSQGFGLQKLSATGELIWYQDSLGDYDPNFNRFTSFYSFSPAGLELALDSEGQPILAFGVNSSPLFNSSLPWVGLMDWLVLRLSSETGSVSQGQVFGTSSDDRLTGMSYDSGLITLWGTSNGAFNGQTPINDTDAVVMQLNDAFELQWTQQFGSHQVDSVYSGTVDNGVTKLHVDFTGEYNGVFNQSHVLELAADGSVSRSTTVNRVFSDSQEILSIEDGAIIFYSSTYSNTTAYRYFFPAE